MAPLSKLRDIAERAARRGGEVVREATEMLSEETPGVPVLGEEEGGPARYLRAMERCLERFEDLRRPGAAAVYGVTFA